MTYFSVGDGPMGQGVANHCKCKRPSGFMTSGQHGPVGRATHGSVVLCGTCGSEATAFKKLTLDLAVRWRQE